MAGWWGATAAPAASELPWRGQCPRRPADDAPPRSLDLAPSPSTHERPHAVRSPLLPAPYALSFQDLGPLHSTHETPRTSLPRTPLSRASTSAALSLPSSSGSGEGLLHLSWYDIVHTILALDDEISRDANGQRPSFSTRGPAQSAQEPPTYVPTIIVVESTRHPQPNVVLYRSTIP